ncbi:MAG: hypothetical protein SF053_09325 [Bacteroidia bacterium]|nr:hypothetical protein [Bacteroidia bacterium]
MRNHMVVCGLLPVLLLLASCGAQPAASSEAPAGISTAAAVASAPPLGDYWYQGLAELSSYDLEQARYGELRQGEAVLVFVTEDFSRSKQVKLDNAEAAGADRLPVLKLNMTKKFLTGIYPYSLMLSVFTPTDYLREPRSVKTTMTVQEWCGHVFNQLNLDKDHYRLRGFSYFESEGDEDKKLPLALLEDELWTLIRIAPDRLPTGKVTLIPGAFYSRLKHRPIEPQAATLALTEQAGVMTYTLTYEAANRSLKINFNKAFPHEITSWEESYPDGWSPDSPVLTTRATLRKRILAPYWTLNHNTDLSKRADLGLGDGL